MQIALATDAWHPQVNGVVRTLNETVHRLRQRGHGVTTITPDAFTSIPCPGYSEIRLAIAPRRKVRKILSSCNPDIVHIATEGPIGWATRRWCIDHGMPFTTALHTRFPDYVAARTPISADRIWPIIRRFHAPSFAVLTATGGLMDELEQRGLRHTRLWSRGVDLDQFSAQHPVLPELAHLPRPILLSVGRVAVEKNLEAFLRLPNAGSKVVVGDGPDLARLKSAYPDVVFTGALHGTALAQAYATADVFVFPSKTDTFGLVIIEALASGVPVAAYPVSGPQDILGASPDAGVLHENLARAVDGALGKNSAACNALGKSYSWDNSVNQFLSALMDASAAKCGDNAASRRGLFA